MKYFTVVLLMILCIIGAWDSQAGTRNQIVNRHNFTNPCDSLSFNKPIAGSVTREWHGVYWQADTFLNSHFEVIRPIAGYGHNRVRLNYIHLNPSPDATLAGGMGNRDSCSWYMMIRLMAWNAGVCDTMTELSNGKGDFIPFIALAGCLTVPSYRSESSWSTFSSTNKTWGNKYIPFVVRPVVEADSFAIDIRKYYRATPGPSLYHAFGYTSYNSTAQGAPPGNRYLHIQYCDTACLRPADFFPWATSRQKDAAIIYACIDLGPRYTASGATAPWGNRKRCDQDFSTTEEEGNVYLYRGDRTPLVSTLSADMTASTSIFYMNEPAGFDDATYKTLWSYRPAGMIDQQSLAWAMQIFVKQPSQSTTEIGRCTWGFTGSLYSTDLCPLDTASNIWRIRLNNDGDDGQPDTVMKSGGEVILSAWPWMMWEGSEDFQLEGYYGTGGALQQVNSAWVPFLNGDLSGQFCNNYGYGIDSIGTGSGQKSQHFTAYRGWPTDHNNIQPLRIREGFEFWYFRTLTTGGHAAGAASTIRFQGMCAFYTFSQPW